MKIFQFITLGVVLFTPLLFANTLEANLSEIAKIKEQIAEEEKLWAEETKQEREKEAKRLERYKSFKDEKKELEQSLLKLDESIQQEINELERLKGQEQQSEYYFKQIREKTLSQIQKLEQYIIQSFPFQKDKRLENVKLLREDLEKDLVSFEEAFNRLLVILEKEVRLGEDSETYSGDFTDENGSTFQVSYLRVGKRIHLFSTPEGSKLGMLDWSAGQPGRWIREDEMDMETRKLIREAIATGDDKALPGFVRVPLTKTSIERK